MGTGSQSSGIFLIDISTGNMKHRRASSLQLQKRLPAWFQESVQPIRYLKLKCTQTLPLLEHDILIPFQSSQLFISHLKISSPLQRDLPLLPSLFFKALCTRDFSFIPAGSQGLGVVHSNNPCTVIMKSMLESQIYGNFLFYI